MKYDSSGFLQVAAFTASGALPLPNIIIRVFGADEENIATDYSVMTNRDGLSEILVLPAPSISYSLKPNAPEQAFARYNVEASGDGYYSKKIFDVEVFSGIKSILPLEMIPTSGMTRYVTPPILSNTSIITENEDLN